ncbi:MAG: T9SS type A sorting domain-containing protein [Taibaiella sp.]|nr:T9SS type A sorting domain-containing protein [Taibaiella sp.]
MRLLLITLLLFATCYARGQYAPQAGVAGATAIKATDSRFVSWGSSCAVKRGWLDIANKSMGFVTSGDSSNAIGFSDGLTVSLGDSGIAIVSFANALYNGDGPDFAIFENGFADPSDPNEAFLELGFVEVSSDGVHYFRFPANDLTSDSVQIRAAGDYMDARKLNNLAGKYTATYGTPFDLQELAGISGLDINNITYIRIIDVIGSVSNNASYDSAGRKVNDPYPSPFPTGGFDLDAVGAIHMKGAGIPNIASSGVSVYPNPVIEKVYITQSELNMRAILTDISGKVLLQQTLSNRMNELQLGGFRSGVYYLILQNSSGEKWVEKITKL